MQNDETDWTSDDIKDLDLELENQALRLDLQIQGGQIFMDEECDPEIDNSFLKRIITYEAMAEEARVAGRPLRSIFPVDFNFPLLDEMNEQELKNKLSEIIKIFQANNIDLSLVDGLPDNIIYTYLTEEAIPEVPGFPYGADCPFTYLIDGCDGYCPDCFQKDYCENALDWDSPLDIFPDE
ncbi:MAG: hypothetical protein JW860_07855 [Sedimentisphaerales bacterium]|nr:hypothetical protein [Sedimentisphaerales bacterium]